MTSMELEESLEDADPLIVGIQMDPVPASADNVLHQMHQDGYDYLVTRLPQQPREDVPRQDVLSVPLKTWQTTIVGRLETPSSGSEPNQQWRYALEWAVHMTLPAVVLPPLPSLSSNTTAPNLGLVAYARFVMWASGHCRASGCKLWIPISPLDEDHLQNWRWLLQFCSFPGNIGMLLQFEQADPPASATGLTTKAWLSRVLHRLHVAIGSGSIYAVQFRTNGFLTNRKGYPTLSKFHQSLFTYLLRRLGQRLRVLVIKEQRQELATLLSKEALGATGCLPHLQYLQHIRQRPQVRAVLDTKEARMEMNYLDSLQQPLQPLKDHLENQTYDTFEKDPIKYREYERAIGMALQDLALQKVVVVAVVGAGRGPLVTAALRAYRGLAGSQRPPTLHVCAVEKNPSAFQRLLSLAQYEATWKEHHVQVLQADLRHLTTHAMGGRPADIVVSELLGSWGCNELSPECLEALWSTNAVHAKTISIPTSYISYVAPVASAKLWQQARQQSLYPNPSETGVVGMNQAMETGYVVRPHEASQMMDAKACWQFSHPSSPGNQELDRTADLKFDTDPDSTVHGCGYGAEKEDIPRSLLSTDSSTVVTPDPASSPWTLTGLLGTFKAVLYQRSSAPEEAAYISTCPKDFSVGMFSWFPLYLPVERPLTVPTDASVRTHLWRQVSEDAVWYEWAVSIWRKTEKGGEECLSMSPIHNQGGRSSKVSL